MREFALLCAVLMVPGNVLVHAQSAAQVGQHEAKVTSEQLDSLVAPIALYPDPLLAEVLAASTYPLGVVEATRWVKDNGTLKGEALVQAAERQDWDPSIQALVVFPSVLRRMDDNLRWTIALGNAFLAQEAGTMGAIQRQRQKAYAAGVMESNAQQKIEIQPVGGANAIVIEPADPQVIAVPNYNPAVVFGAAPEDVPYPTMVYPPPPSSGEIVTANVISFGFGVALGPAFAGCCGYGGWGWGFHWGPHPSLYVNNIFMNRYGFRIAPYANGNAIAGWVHNPYYRRAVPYPSAAVASRYGWTQPVAISNKSTVSVRSPGGSAGAAKAPDATDTAPKPDVFSGVNGSGTQARIDAARGTGSLSARTATGSSGRTGSGGGARAATKP
ncbi:MAG: DUF3300 domain-containing protein [Acidobacteriaceae bacterium]|nr:DUF3300 domain-containing protein [Acidobacteriaceae bacterium]